jgi:hypothetical protein
MVPGAGSGKNYCRPRTAGHSVTTMVPSGSRSRVGAYRPNNCRHHHVPVARFSAMLVNQYCQSTARICRGRVLRKRIEGKQGEHIFFEELAFELITPGLSVVAPRGCIQKRQLALLARQSHEASYQASCEGKWHSQEDRLAYFPSLLRHLAEGEWRRRQDGPGNFTAREQQNNARCLHASGELEQAEPHRARL